MDHSTDEASAVTTVDRWLPVASLVIEERASTADEQRRFEAALGDRFTGLLAVVNGALAAWPVLRRDGVAGAKADYVAVCLYLGASGEGAVSLNSSLRGGRLPSLDGYLQCLVSGLRLLPLHRRAVVCQARVGSESERLYPLGSVVAETGFLSTSVAIDRAVRDVDVDFLIWPRTARQAGVLSHDRDGDEAVFGAGSRFKVLAIHTTTPSAEPSDGVPVPTTSVLLRELLPNERPVGSDLDEADRVTLRRLEDVLRQRRADPAREIDDADLVARFAGAPPGFIAEASRGEVEAA
jgi:hypothetical protein